MCDCDKKKKDSGNGGNLCKKVNFTLEVILNFKDGKREKLRTQFKSTPDIRGCNIPNKKDFDKAYTKLKDNYSRTLPKDKPMFISKNTQLSSTVSSWSCTSWYNCHW